MKRSVNLIRNAGFARGPDGLDAWTARAVGRGATVRRTHLEGGAVTPSNRPGVTLRGTGGRSRAEVSQVVRCKPEEFYHLDADVLCELAGENGDGLILAVEPLDEKGRSLNSGCSTPALTRAASDTTIRVFYKTPPGARSLRVIVRIDRATGWTRVHRVRCLSILDPEECSHPLAIPPPPHTLAPSRIASRVAVVSATEAPRPITTILKAWFGENSVSQDSPNEWAALSRRADAILLPDAELPKNLRSVPALMKLARDRIVVISLPAWAHLAGGAFRIRRVTQEDDPIAARIAYGDAWTPGFALDDTIAFAWSEGPLDTFAQRQFRKTPAFRDACKKLGLATRLTSMCQQDATSFQPVALSKDTPGGALFIMDLEPCEDAGSTMNEPSLAAQLLLGFLGHARSGLGQYTVPATREAEFRADIRETANRFAGFVVHDDDVPTDEVRSQLVTIGREDQDFGLPLRPKPVILVRSGIETGDAESAYAAFLWFKQLVRMPPLRCPYAASLTSAFRLAWVPFGASWSLRCGWGRGAAAGAEDMDIDAEEGLLSAVIDLVSRPAQRVRVVVPEPSDDKSRLEQWLPALSRAFLPQAYFGFETAPGRAYSDRDQAAWRRFRPDVEIAADPDSFDAAARRAAAASGAHVARIEFPGSDADFPAHSITRTDIAATMLEHVIGLHYGLIAVNRSRQIVTFDGFEPLQPGEALTLRRDDPALRLARPRAG